MALVCAKGTASVGDKYPYLVRYFWHRPLAQGAISVLAQVLAPIGTFGTRRHSGSFSGKRSLKRIDR
jgi:hypothetical protein